MSVLTHSLKQIQNWLENNFPRVAESITPGLSISEIESKIENLPFSLPEEVYELYQWSGGNNLDTQNIYTNIFDVNNGMALNTLEYAIEVFPNFIDEEFEECTVNYIGKPLFPIFGTDATFLCIVGDWEEKTPSPIVYVSEILEMNHSFVNLTTMIQALAESIQANALGFNSKSYIKWDEEKYTSIYLKHNYNILEFSVNKLKRHLLIAETNSISEEKAEETFRFDIDILDIKRRELASRSLDYQIVEPLIQALEDEDKRVRNLVKWGLEELEYEFE